MQTTTSSLRMLMDLEKVLITTTRWLSSTASSTQAMKCGLPMLFLTHTLTCLTLFPRRSITMQTKSICEQKYCACHLEDCQCLCWQSLIASNLTWVMKINTTSSKSYRRRNEKCSKSIFRSVKNFCRNSKRPKVSLTNWLNRHTMNLSTRFLNWTKMQILESTLANGFPTTLKTTTRRDASL